MSGHVTADPRLPLSSRPRSRNIRYTLLDRPCSATTARLLSATSTSALAIGHRAFLLGSVIERRTRCARVLRADSAAWLRGSQDPVREECLDGPGHEQIRARARGHGSRQDVQGGMAVGLPLGLGRLLYRRASRDDQRRAHATGINIRSLMPVLMWFSSAMKIENLHPLQWGIFRVKYRKERRPGFPIESPLSFHSGYASETAAKATKLARRWLHLRWLHLKSIFRCRQALSGRGSGSRDRGKRRAYGALHPE
jgi:hypothetical protein